MNDRARRLADWLVETLCGGPLPPIEQERARGWLLQAAAALGLMDVEAVDPFPADTFGYQASTLVAAVEGTARRLLGESVAYGRGRPVAGGPYPGLPSMRRGSVAPVRDVNAATLEQLVAVPGLGPASAGRLVAQRSLAAFTDLDAVRRGSGIDRQAWERAVPALSLDPSVTARSRPEPLPVVRLAELGRQGRGPLVGVTGARPGAARRAALALCCQSCLRSPLVPRLFAPGRARQRANTLALARHLGPVGAPVDGVALVQDQAYLELLSELVDNAQSSIRVAMFFLDGGSRDVRGLVDRLAAARARGVAVRLVLGDDLPGDRHGAATTNAEGRALLRAAGLPTRLHWPEMALHEKSVVVDDRWSLVGSHNWTPRSLFAAAETSMCVDSPALAADLRSRFDDLWRALDPNASRRRVATSLLDQLTPAARARLRALRLVRPAVLTADPAEQRRLARALGLPVADLRHAAATSRLMEGLRVCEATAALLVAARLTTPQQVSAAGSVALRRALGRTVTTPARLAGRRVNPDLASVLAPEGDDGA